MSTSAYASDAKIAQALTAIGAQAVGQTTQDLLRQIFVAAATNAGGGGGSPAAWGSITGTLSAQTDLQTALDTKANLVGDNTFTGAQMLAAGSFASPALQVGGSAAGIYLSTATTGILSFRENNYNGFRFVDTDGNIIPMTVNNSIGLTINSNCRVGGVGGFGQVALGTGGTLNVFLNHGGAATLQQGLTSATPVDQLFKGPDGSGTNIQGGDLRLGPGRSTGSGTPAVLALQGTTVGSSGTTTQSLVDVLTILTGSTIQIADGVLVDVGSTNGSIFGSSPTAKIGFFGTTATPQPAQTSGGGIVTPGSGVSVLDDSTFTGGIGTTEYTVGAIVANLKTLGLLAA